ncbi:MAG: glycosyltransferase family 2 protein [Candidatus Staskawiczbacteria bacterium]|nr:glycosyltransferase family 2 protein [Candidatus Staskawiczbacteria bacterium]
MKISIITPSLNQGEFIEETIKSVINQTGDFDLEYIIIDGKSSDNSINIIKEYDQLIKSGEFIPRCKSLKYIWLSEKDRGQSQAINKGLKISSGEIINWLCSDDLLENGALQEVSTFFEKNKNTKVVFGQNLFIKEKGEVFRHFKSREFNRPELIKRWNSVYWQFNIPQPSTFARRDLLSEIGYLNTGIQFCMDYDWYLRINKKYKLYLLDKFLSKSRYHKTAKSIAKRKEQYKESIDVSKKYWPENYFYYYSSYLLDKLSKLVEKKIYSFPWNYKGSGD